jgi:hypothetical protein
VQQENGDQEKFYLQLKEIEWEVEIGNYVDPAVSQVMQVVQNVNVET